MAHVFFRVAAGNFLIHRKRRRQRRFFGIRTGVYFVYRTARGNLHRRCRRRTCFQDINQTGTPLGSRGLVFDISIYAVQQALTAQLGQLAVKIFTRLAEEFVGGVAKAEDRKGGARQFWRFFGACLFSFQVFQYPSIEALYLLHLCP